MQLNFNAQQFDPRQSASAFCFPLGDYLMEIVKIEPVETKDSTPQHRKGFLEVTLKCLQGEHAGQIQIDRLNLFGQGEDATRIASQNLAAYCYIAGKPSISDTNELVGTKLIATIGPQINNDKYSEVKVRKDLAGNPPVQGKPCAPQSGGLQTQLMDSAPASAQGQNAPWSSPQQASQPPANAWQQQPSPAENTQPATSPWGAGQSNPPASGNKPPWMQ